MRVEKVILHYSVSSVNNILQIKNDIYHPNIHERLHGTDGGPKGRWLGTPANDVFGLTQ